MISWLTKDWGLKLIALILAIGLWYYATGEENIEITRTVPLKIEIENPQLSILDVSSKTIKVTLNTPRSFVGKLASERIYAVHKSGKGIESSGEYSFRLQPSEIKLPSFQVRVVKIEPEIVTVTFDELIAQKLKIQPDFMGEPAVGYKVQEEKIQLDPNAILIEGPRSEFEKMESVKTRAIDLIGRIRSFRRTVEVDLPSTMKALSESFVDVYVPIKEEFSEKEYDDISIHILKSPKNNSGIKIKPEQISFVLTGAGQRLEKLDTENIVVYIDVSDLAIGTHELPLQGKEENFLL